MLSMSAASLRPVLARPVSANLECHSPLRPVTVLAGRYGCLQGRVGFLQEPFKEGREDWVAFLQRFLCEGSC